MEHVTYIRALQLYFFLGSIMAATTGGQWETGEAARPGAGGGGGGGGGQEQEEEEEEKEEERIGEDGNCDRILLGEDYR
jgi:hypothetical protein